jgi:hypothetical protein
MRQTCIIPLMAIDAERTFKTIGNDEITCNLPCNCRCTTSVRGNSGSSAAINSGIINFGKYNYMCNNPEAPRAETPSWSSKMVAPCRICNFYTNIFEPSMSIPPQPQNNSSIED